jgi:hypothetical protein
MRNTFIRFLHLTFLAVAVVGCVSHTDEKQYPKEEAIKPITKTGAPVTVVPNPVRWRYSETDDEMGRGRVYLNLIESTNTISLDPPYEGAQHATLALRQHPKDGGSIIFAIEKGQLLESEYYAKTLVRFDDGKPIAFSSSKSGDQRTNVLFLHGAFPVFLKRLKTAKTVRIQVPIYQAGMETFDFSVEGFTWKP